MELLRDVGHVKSRFDPFGDVLVSSKLGAQFATNGP
jgi:hypothetical protein